ncbi:uncharacterized protein TRIADDRAFT_60311 [Trichoplax adhaerens]|uniref:G-protein coupled receptors family 1 profile domain-containing protein n=1 Tax=Trichoplax adhaerens TaxID=10228 RepID=B3S7V7_TRIAD|nr:hypothetical protein TRIADDRAFT_60311 [Trichoplax adhaerens]EDV21260.1 hypothetical protein TRIADDRAFT_60311 [Trichoplax adhaerens]|eukprot:XP_002116227.1 hypothetical protein TRIADDRAFT_60311 [Trichoplax adhaerens]
MNATERIQVLQQFDSLRAVSWIIGILALIANISVIIWMVCYMYNPLRWFSQRNPRNITNNPYLLIIFNLAVADLLGALYLIILAISDATFKINGDFQTPNGTYINNWIVSPTCFLERILSQVSLLMSIFITFFITVSRFIQVVCPYSGLEVTIKKSRIALLSLWIISFTIAIVGAVESSHVSLRKQDHLSILGFLCQLESLETPVIIGIVYSELLLGIIGYVGTIILYLIIACKLKKTRSSINSINRSKAESKIHLIIAWIVLLRTQQYHDSSYIGKLS